MHVAYERVERERWEFCFILGKPLLLVCRQRECVGERGRSKYCFLFIIFILFKVCHVSSDDWIYFEFWKMGEDCLVSGGVALINSHYYYSLQFCFIIRTMDLILEWALGPNFILTSVNFLCTSYTCMFFLYFIICFFYYYCLTIYLFIWFQNNFEWTIKIEWWRTPPIYFLKSYSHLLFFSLKSDEKDYPGWNIQS